MKKTISGIRGIFGKDLCTKDVIRFCTNFADLTQGKCVIGMDTRPSGPMMLDTATAALLGAGVDVHVLRMVPTPVVFRKARESGGAGIVITSSHNPLEWNGLKFIIDSKGITEEQLPHIISKPTKKTQQYVTPGKLIQDATNTYVDDAIKIISDVSKMSDHHHRPEVVIDIGGGAAAEFAPSLLERIGCKTTVINKDLQGCSRGPDPTTDNLSHLMNTSSKKDIGFAFDLDGDRLVIVKDGVHQVPDVTLGLGIARTLDLGYKKFVLSVDTSMSVEKMILDRGGICIRSKVGESNVVDMIYKSGAQAGGEGSSGGFILPEFNNCRDGILTSGLVASMLANRDNNVNDVINMMNEYHQIRTKVFVPSTLHESSMECVKSWLESECSEVDMTDGVKGIIDEGYWVLVRRSNTEDAIRISVESDKPERCKQIVKQASQVLLQSG